VNKKNQKCFADTGKACNALMYKDCDKCKFYKSSKDFIDGVEKYGWQSINKGMYTDTCRIAVKNLEV